MDRTRVGWSVGLMFSVPGLVFAKGCGIAKKNGGPKDRLNISLAYKVTRVTKLPWL